ncbi:hypothetical protein M0804_000648 [Polistes exclamans]|nr:hypothetical protein M0804_000648 [Polistes exclamans]
MRWRWRLETRTPKQQSTPALPQILDFTRSVLGFSRGCQEKEVEETGGRGEGRRGDGGGGMIYEEATLAAHSKNLKPRKK